MSIHLECYSPAGSYRPEVMNQPYKDLSNIDLPSYELKIENSLHGKLFKIKMPREAPTLTFQRKQIWINGFCAKYIKDFNKNISNTIFPDKLIIIESENRCLAQYNNLSLLGWDLISLEVNPHVPEANIIKIQAPTGLKIIGLKQHIRDELKLNIAYKKSTFKSRISVLENPFTLKYYGLKNYEKITFVLPLKKGLQRGTSKEGLLFDKNNFSNLQIKLNQLWNLIFYIKGREAGGYGSGFLIGRNKILTNYHVVSLEKTLDIYFFYDQPDKGTPTFTITLTDEIYYFSPFRSVGYHKNITLDFAIITIPQKDLREVEKKVSHWKSLQKLACEFFKEPVISPKKGIPANIIQHYDGKEKKIVFQSNELIKVGDNTLHYSTLTYKGTSGSPIISNEGKFLGYHFGECEKLIRRIQKICELNINKITFIPSYYKDIDDPQITWIIFANAKCIKLTNSPDNYKDESVELLTFIKDYNGPLDIGIETPEFFDKKFIEIHRKHRHCMCGIPATLLMQDNTVQNILKENENYLEQLSSEQPQNIQAPSPSSQNDDRVKRLEIAVISLIVAVATIGVFLGYRHYKKKV